MCISENLPYENVLELNDRCTIDNQIVRKNTIIHPYRD